MDPFTMRNGSHHPVHRKHSGLSPAGRPADQLAVEVTERQQLGGTLKLAHTVPAEPPPALPSSLPFSLNQMIRNHSKVRASFQPP